MPAPAPKTSAVIGRSLLISAATMFLIAFLIGTGTLAMESAQVISGALVAVGIADVAIGMFFLRKGRSS